MFVIYIYLNEFNNNIYNLMGNEKTRLLAVIFVVVLLIISVGVPHYILSLVRLYTSVNIVFDFRGLKYGGSELTGGVNIALIGPGGISIHRYNLSDVLGKGVTVDLREGLMAWDRYFRDVLPREMRMSMRYDVPLPAITIFMILHDNAGNEYVASYVYSTFDYLMDHHQDNVKATNEAIMDPLIMFRNPLSIKVTSEKLGIRKVDFRPLIENIRKSFSKASSQSTSSIRYEALSCPSYFTEVYWSTLYNSRNNLPDGWRQRISGYNINDQMKLEAWNYYASEYSLAYYYKASEYTATAALTAVKNRLGEEGVYTMWSFLYDIFYKLYGDYGTAGLTWDSVYTPGKTFSEDTPIISIRVDYVEQKPIEFRIEAEKWTFNQYKHGLTILGTTALASSKTITYYFNKVAYVRLNTQPKQYILIPTTYEYSTDGVVLTYDVSLVTYGGCDYWRVVPITTFIPLYLKTAQDWRDAYVVSRGLNDPDPPSFIDMVWDYDVRNINWTYVNDNTPPNEPFFQDQSVNYSVSESVAGQQVNIIKSVLTIVLTSILSEGHPVAALMISLAGSFTGYAETNARNTAIILKLEVSRYGSIGGNVYVSVNKYTIKYASSELYGYLPLMVRYKAQIGYQQNPAPLNI